MSRLHLNESPYRVPPELVERAFAAVGDRLNLYPDTAVAEVRERYAAYASDGARLTGNDRLRPEQVVPGNGADEAIDLCVLALRPLAGQVVLPTPTFSEYARAAQVGGLEVVRIPLGPGFGLDWNGLLAAVRKAPSLVFLCNPNNPTGNLVAGEVELERLAVAAPGTWVIVDEAYWEFSGFTALPLVARHPNLVVVRTMSKAFCLAGIRLGYAIAAPETARKLDTARMYFNVDAFTAAVARAALDEPGYVREVVAKVLEGRRRLEEGLAAIPGFEPHPSRTNFVLTRTPRPAADIAREMAVRGILVRAYPRDPALAHELRISVGTPPEVEACLGALRECGPAGGK